MKLAVVIATASAFTTETRVARQAELEADKRYFQLTDMMEHYNPDFDERKYWAYGCNCLILGDRPMSDPGLGPPVDALDSVCKRYKDCVKCVKQEYGDECIGEFVMYKYRFQNGDVTCRNNANTCERAVCECDAQFAREHLAATDVFSDEYHMFWSTNDGGEMWDPANDATQCVPSGTKPVKPECCNSSNNDQAFVIYNALVKDCCADGSVAPTGQC